MFVPISKKKRRTLGMNKGWSSVFYHIISSYDIMLHLDSCSWSSHFLWTYNPFLARLDMPGVSRSLEVYCCHWLFANSKEIGAWKDWAGVGADVLRWRNQQPYWGYWGLCLYPGFCFKGWWAELNQLNLHEISKFEIQMRWSVLISRCPMVALWIVTRKGYEHFHGPFFSGCIPLPVISMYQWYPITSWLVWYPHCVPILARYLLFSQRYAQVPLLSGWLVTLLQPLSWGGPHR